MEPTKLTVLLQVFDDFQHILLRYSADYTMKIPKKGYDAQYWEWSQKVNLVQRIIEDEEFIEGEKQS